NAVVMVQEIGSFMVASRRVAARVGGVVAIRSISRVIAPRARCNARGARSPREKCRVHLDIPKDLVRGPGFPSDFSMRAALDRTAPRERARGWGPTVPLSTHGTENCTGQ